MKAILLRSEFTATQTLGRLLVIKQGRVVFDRPSLELPWKDNKPNVSCIPPATYSLVIVPDHYRFSRRGYDPYLVKQVPNRSEIMGHHGNHFFNLRGCWTIGQGYVDINGDGHKDVTSSINTFKELNKVLTRDMGEIEFEVIGLPEKPFA